MDLDAIAALKALTDVARLRIVGRLGAGPATTDQLVADLSMPLPVVVRQLGLLRRSGLVIGADGGEAPGWSLRLDTLQDIGRALDQLERAAEAEQPPLAGADGESPRRTTRRCSAPSS